MLETLLISGGIAAMTVMGVKVGCRRCESDLQAQVGNAKASVLIETFRAQAEIDRIYLNTLEQINAAERALNP